MDLEDAAALKRLNMNSVLQTSKELALFSVVRWFHGKDVLTYLLQHLCFHLDNDLF